MLCDKIICPADDCPKDCQHRLIADRLQKLADGFFGVSFSPKAILDDDDEGNSLGHVYVAFPSLDALNVEYDLDDRRPESLDMQFMTAMRQHADSCRKMADAIDERLAGQSFPGK